jgi:hypothetical protein
MLYETLVGLSPARDADLLEGYQRYEATLEAILTAVQLEIYAESIRRTGMIRIVEELTPVELAELPPDERIIAIAIQADEDSTMENRRVVALLNHYGQHAVAPDLDVPARDDLRNEG